MTKKRKIIKEVLLEESKIEEWEKLREHVENYFQDIEKYRPDGDDGWISYYKSARGFFKYYNRLPSIKFDDFGKIDYKLWEWILKTVKPSGEPAMSGGLFFRHSKVDDFCSKASFYRSRKRFVHLQLLIKTPFKDYYIINPEYVIKLFNPKR